MKNQGEKNSNERNLEEKELILANLDKSKTLGEKLKKSLKYKKVTYRQFAKLIDKSESTVSAYANNRFKPSIKMIHKFEEILEIPFKEYYSNVSDETKIIKSSKTFGKNLKIILNDKGITQEKFAELMNKNSKTINAYANDRIKPSVEVLHKMEEVLGVPFKEYYPYIPDIDAINASKTFREKLKKALKYNNGMTCVELADLMDKEPKDVYAYTTHRRKPTIEEFHQLEEILGVSFEEYYPYMPTLADVNAAETLGEKIRRALIYKKISVKKLAKLTHRSQNNIYSYINNKYKPSARLLYLLEGILGISFKEYYLGLA